MSVLGKSALAYAGALGVRVHPISRTKAPLSPHGFKDATTDAQQIRQWWATHPNANIGAACDWFFVVDVDPRSGGRETVNGWGRDMPETWEAETGSGGTHWYFRHHEALDSVPLGALGPAHPGVDIKGGNRGYVLLPPSVSNSGPYRWERWPRSTPLADAPDWLISLILEAKRRPVHAPRVVDTTLYQGVDRVERARRYARRISPAVSGSGGHHATIKVAACITRGFALSKAEAFSVLAEWNRSCEPPWSDEELMRKIEQTLASGGGSGWLLDRSP